jgi:signal transduction histidine kinase
MPSKAEDLKILIVDDDEAFVQVFLKRLNSFDKFSCLCERSHSGAEMLDKVYRQAYDLIFLDADLPGMDGLEVLARVGQTTLPLPIVMTASRQNVRVATQAMKRGVLDFLLKEDLLALDLNFALPDFLRSFRLRQENAELKQINQMKDDFLATISHELRTPLTSILGLCEVLLTGRMGSLQDEQTQSLKKILTQSQNLVRLINQLLDIRAFTQSVTTLEMKRLDFRTVVAKEWDAVQAPFQKKAIKATLTAGAEPVWIEAHEDNLRKVVEQILLNAAKFTPKQGSVQAEVRRMDSGHVQFKVADSGQGIPANALPHVFQKFFHADQTLTRPYGGMGLGLAFCREVIEVHGGRIWVESKGSGQGTTVSFLLPGAPEPRAPRVAAPAAPSTNGKKTIVWVDDNTTLLDLVKYGFAGFAFPVNLLTAESGAAFLAHLEKGVPDLIVLDVMMPEIDGLELLERLRREPRTRNVPVLVVSGYKDVARTVLEKGANDFCAKPFQIHDIFKKIEGLLLAPSV